MGSFSLQEESKCKREGKGKEGGKFHNSGGSTSSTKCQWWLTKTTLRTAPSFSRNVLLHAIFLAYRSTNDSAT